LNKLLGDIDNNAYLQLSAAECAFVDTWVATGRVKEALAAAGYTTTYYVTATKWFRKPHIRRAIYERIEALQEIVPDLIADQAEVLQTISFLMRESKDEAIQLKAACALQRHWAPDKFKGANEFNLKELLDQAEQLQNAQQEKKVHR
jgi:phage terminase small subunit